MSRYTRVKKLIGFSAFAGGSYLLGSWILEDPPNAWGPSTAHNNPLNVRHKRPIPLRSLQLKSLETETFDVLVIGGGATGAGCALDSVTRGLKTALVEQDDFSSGTSSRSTKLIHGGVRYLQKALMHFDIEQFRMVKEALHERGNLLEIAPHLSYPLPIMLPVYKWWQVPYFWVGIKMYDLVAGSKCLKKSYYLTKQDALELFPMLRSSKLCGALVYYDGAHNDARMNLAIIITATRMGASAANHCKVLDLLKERDLDGVQHIVGAKVRDEMTGREFSVRAKCVINATGPFVDTIRKMDNQAVSEICVPSSGVHIVLPGYYSPERMGLLDPDTSDGRVIFFLPWLKNTIAGTTDSHCEVTQNPSPSERDIQFILHEIKNYLSPDLEVRRGDVLSAWSGIRPLVSDPNKPDTQSLARNHIVHVSESGLVTIGGGKWTTYRAMAKEGVDVAVKQFNLKADGPSQTDGLLLEGAHGYSPTVFIRLVQDIGLEPEVAKHLANTYGDRAFSVAKSATLTGKRFPVVGKKIHPEFPYIEAEIKYAIKEYACTATDVIARRLRLAFLNVQAAEESLPKIIEIMGDELNWSKEERRKQHDDAMEFLNTQMGKNTNVENKDKLEYILSREEKEIYTKRFQTLDTEKKGYISIVDLRKGLERQGETISGEVLHDILKELDTNRNGQVELDEYLAMMSAIKSGNVVNSRFVRMIDMEQERLRKETYWRKSPTVERSGGGF